jgi:hypothetical protein
MKHSSVSLIFLAQSMQNTRTKKLRSYFQRLLSLAVFIFLYCISGYQLAYGQWSPNAPVSIGGGQHPGIVSDGAGGSIIAWYTGNSIGASKINAGGFGQWSATIGSGFGQQVPVSIVSDGAGGAITTWIGLDHKIYVQRVNASGILQWTAGGVIVCTTTDNLYEPSITSDGAGGAIIAWFDHRSGVGLYAQHVDASGIVQWVANGIAVCNTNVIETINDFGPRIADDGSGGAILSWRDNRNGNPDIYAQRLSSFGTVQWGAGGIAISALASNQGTLNMTSDKAGGAIISWQDNRNGNNDIYAQRINELGIAQWTTDGVSVCILGGDDNYPIIVNDGASGAIIAWQRTNSIYSQKINSIGELQWAAGPLPICTAVNYISAPMIAVDGAGGAIITWMDARNNDYDIYAQRVVASGAIQWMVNGAGVCTTAGGQGYPVILNNGSNGAFISWNNSPSGLYAQNVNDDGTIGPPATPIVSCPSGNTSITSNLTGATYQWQVNTGSGFTNISNNGNYTGTNTITLQLNTMPSGWYGYIYRCIVNGAYSTNSKLKFSDNWTGTTNNNWEDAANWSCGTIPDANTDVIINNGLVTVNENTTVRTLTLAPGVIFTVAPGVILTITH